ncbi:hypothetical protein BBTM_00852 [Bifidobacterium bifidum]|nr:hypothetical protein BBTM_00852 [Bifidobacterium bifidum]
MASGTSGNGRPAHVSLPAASYTRSSPRISHRIYDLTRNLCGSGSNQSFCITGTPR